MQPGTRIMTSTQMGKVRQSNTVTARQKMMVAQQENISNDITLGTVCEWNALRSSMPTCFYLITSKSFGIWKNPNNKNLSFVLQLHFIPLPPIPFYYFLNKNPDKSKSTMWVQITSRMKSACLIWYMNYWMAKFFWLQVIMTLLFNINQKNLMSLAQRVKPVLTNRQIN